MLFESKNFRGNRASDEQAYRHSGETETRESPKGPVPLLEGIHSTCPPEPYSIPSLSKEPLIFFYLVRSVSQNVQWTLHRVRRGQQENNSPLDSPCSVTCFLLLLGRAWPQGQRGGPWDAGRSTPTAPAAWGLLVAKGMAFSHFYRDDVGP